MSIAPDNVVHSPIDSAATFTRARREMLLGLFTVAGRRLLFALLVAPAIIFLTYFGLDMARGEPAGAALRFALPRTPLYLARLLRGDLGMTAAGSITQRPLPVSDVLPEMLARSLGLLAVALVIAAVSGVLLGIVAAQGRRSGRSLALLLLSIVGVSLPSFFLALILQLGLLKWSQTTGVRLLPVGGFGWDAHIVLPALVLAARPLAQIFRVTYLTVADALRQDFVRTAQSKGLRHYRIMGRHVLRNAMIPVLTTVGLSLRFSLSSLPVVEFFFGWPGVGFTLLKAIARRDDNLAIVLVLCLGVFFILVNLLLDLSYRLIDPRLRGGPNGSRPRSGRFTFRASLGEALTGLREWFTRLARRGKERSDPDPFQALLARRETPVQAGAQDYSHARRSAWVRGTLGNGPFLLGLLIVAALGVVFFLGPQIAPHSPYTTQGLEYVDGQFRAPPFAPDAIHPLGTDALGRDVLSLILAGAQQTLLLALSVVAVRLAVGFVLGALAGWFSDTWLDRSLVGLAEVLAAFPTLLLAMILILGLGIRQGMSAFLIGLSVVGWGEIMQFVRSETLSIRPRPFIESAVAVGQTAPRIIWQHVLPNLLPALISLAALEMGAVLMLLGELGFIGIFIGGGAFAELDIGAAPYHYSDVPEWGALLSNVRSYARSYPWMAVYPALAFFLAILGFNLFGEGLRRMVETVGIGVRWVLNRTTFAVVLVLLLGLGWVRENTGAVAVYRRQAQTFDASRALALARELADPALQGRGLDTPGLDAAADQIAVAFQALGLQPAGEDLTYFQPRVRSYERLDDIPRLELDAGPAPVYRTDYVEYPGFFRNLGAATGPVEVFVAGELLRTRGFGGFIYPALDDKDFSGKILMVLSERDLAYVQNAPRGGVLVVQHDPDEDPAAFQRRTTLSALDPTYDRFGTGQRIGQDAPVFWISRPLADRLLASTGHTVESLRRAAEDLPQDAVATVETGVRASMEIAGTVVERVPVRHVAGYLPGQAGFVPGGGEALDNQLGVVLVQYDGPPPHPDGVPIPGASQAGGLAVVLEAIRTLQASGYQPYRSLLFVAYSGEGIEGGKFQQRPEAAKFLQAKYGFSSAFEVEAVIRVEGFGVGAGDALQLAAGGNLRLASLFERAARQMGASTVRAREPVDISVVFDEGSPFDSGQEAPEISLTWAGTEAVARTPQDVPTALSEGQLREAGRTLALALMILGREREY